MSCKRDKFDRTWSASNPWWDSLKVKQSSTCCKLYREFTISTICDAASDWSSSFEVSDHPICLPISKMTNKRKV